MHDKSLKNYKRSNRRFKPNKTRKMIHPLVPINPTLEEKKLCCAIRFYDNMDEMIRQFHTTYKYVESIKVSDKPNKEIMKGNPKASLYTQEFMKIYPENTFAKYLLTLKNKEIQTNIAFTENDAKNLYKWASNPNIKTKVVIFDWDGTLSVIEGIIIPPTKKTTLELLKDGVTYSDIAIYYAGTKTRLNWLRQMFHYLYKKNVKVFILTNNPVAACNWRKLNDPAIGPYSRYNYYKIVKKFIPQIKEQNILCGYETNGFKPETFFNNPYLREIYTRIQHWNYLSANGVN
jgi:hypothetical protein